MPPEPMRFKTTCLHHTVSAGKNTRNKKPTGPVQPGGLDLFPSGAIEFIENNYKKSTFTCKSVDPALFQHAAGVSHTAAFGKGKFSGLFCKNCCTERIQRIDMG